MPKDQEFRTDPYGFAVAAIIGFETQARMMRGTGRTTRLLAEARAGDFIVAAKAGEADLLSRALLKVKKEGVTVICADPTGELHDIIRNKVRELRKRPGRLFFSDNFCEEFTRSRLKSVASELASVQNLCTSPATDYPAYIHDQMLRSMPLPGSAFLAY